MNNKRLAAVHLDDTSEKDHRRAFAVSETRRLRELYLNGDMPQMIYLGHLRRLQDHILNGTELPPVPQDPPKRMESGLRVRTPSVSLDNKLIGYLLGFEEEDEEEQHKRFLGGL